MKIYIGTSGWCYSWNPKKSIEWYRKETGFNTIELNSSYYKIPSEKTIESWKKHGGNLKWAVKIYKGITHMYKLSGNSFSILDNFFNVFSPMERIIKFYLFQFPPQFHNTPLNRERIITAIEKYPGLKKKFAFEFRHKSWLTEDAVSFINNTGGVFVSIDSPLENNMIVSNNAIYLRMHGRRKMYADNYSDEELKIIAGKIKSSGAKEAYIYFNNDFMYPNGKKFMELAGEAKEKIQKELF